MAARSDPISPQDQFAASLAAATALVTSAGAAVGTATGVINRAARDHPVALIAGFALAVMAILMSVIPLAAIWPNRANSVFRKFFLGLTPIAFAAGVSICIVTVLLTVTHPAQQLAISGGVAQTANGEALNVTVKGGGLTSTDHVQVMVNASGSWTDWEYGTTVGVDPSGSVDDAINLTLPHGPYTTVKVDAWVSPARDGPASDCPTKTPDATCVLFNVKSDPPHPQIVASLTGAGATQVVQVQVNANEVVPGSAVAVVVGGTPVPPPVPQASPRRDPVFYSTVMWPDSDGKVTGMITIPIGTRFQNVCVMAKVTASDESWPPKDMSGCPPQGSSDVAWTSLILN